MRVGSSHALVALGQESVFHIRLEHRLDFPLNEVMDRALDPGPAEANPTLAMLVKRKLCSHRKLLLGLER